MTFRVRIDPLAQREIDDFAAYTSSYSEEFAVEQFARLDDILSRDLAESPLRWTYFVLTGAPYRAVLFRVGRRTQYWIIYTVDEEDRTVTILRFWKASRNPEALDL
jgi:mRNA-degrading endonuclease RelE of RelBE toxin-antitoxin system